MKMSNVRRTKPFPSPRKSGCAVSPGNRECTKTRHLHGFTERDFTVIVRRFTRSREKIYRREMAFYADMPSWDEVLEAAALCRTKAGLMHDHQRRIGKEKVKTAYHRLKRADLQLCQNFEDLVERICTAVRGLDRIGELYIYDVAQRLGAKLGFAPTHVYLHAGTRRGVRALELPASGPFLRMSELPTSIQKEPPALLEDFFCMRKDCLRPSMLGVRQPR